MPRPTAILEFGEESSSADGVFCVPHLDHGANLDENGEELTRFLDSELVYILLHKEDGAIVKNVRTSYGTIINAYSPRTVIRIATSERVVFKSDEEEKTLRFIPAGGVSASWYGNSRTISVDGRKMTCVPAPGIADISYTYKALQYILQIPELGLEKGDEFPVDISFEVE